MPVSNGSNQQSAADVLREAAMQESAAVLQKFNTTAAGLSEAEVETRLLQYGPNEVAQEKKHSWLWRLWIAALNPLVILLSLLAIITFATANEPSDYIGGSLMVLMVMTPSSS